MRNGRVRPGASMWSDCERFYIDINCRNIVAIPAEYIQIFSSKNAKNIVLPLLLIIVMTPSCNASLLCLLDEHCYFYEYYCCCSASIYSNAKWNIGLLTCWLLRLLLLICDEYSLCCFHKCFKIILASEKKNSFECRFSVIIDLYS